MKYRLLLAFLLLGSVKLQAQSNNSLIQVTDLTKIKQLSGVTISHNGKWAAFTVNQIIASEEQKGEYDYKTQIYVVPVDGSAAPRALTNLSQSASQPAWSPDDQQLAFVRGTKKGPQIFTLSMSGGEPQQITDHKYGASTPKWSPDGKQILFSTSLNLNEMLKDSLMNPGQQVPVWPLEKPGVTAKDYLNNKTKADPNGNLAAIRAYLSQNEAERKAKVFTKLDFQGEASTNPEFNFNHYLITEAKPNAKPRILTKGYYSFGSADFFPDGKSLILASDIDSLKHPDRSNESEIYKLDLATGKLQQLLGKAGLSYSSPSVSPTGKWLAFQFAPAEGINIPKLGLMSLTGNNTIIEIPFDRNKGSLTWSPDEAFLYFTAQSNGGAPIYRLDMKTKKIQQLGDYNAGLASFDVSKNALVYTKTEVANPFELYSAD